MLLFPIDKLRKKEGIMTSIPIFMGKMVIKIYIPLTRWNTSKYP
jgi:hypothetical protein